MSVSPEILAQQAAYAARPYAVRWVDSHFATTNRFSTLNGAFEYAHAQWARIRREVATRPNHESLLHRSFLETPAGRVQLRYVFLCDDVSSYRQAAVSQSDMNRASCAGRDDASFHPSPWRGALRDVYEQSWNECHDPVPALRVLPW